MLDNVFSASVCSYAWIPSSCLPHLVPCLPLLVIGIISSFSCHPMLNSQFASCKRCADRAVALPRP